MSAILRKRKNKDKTVSLYLDIYDELSKRRSVKTLFVLSNYPDIKRKQIADAKRICAEKNYEMQTKKAVSAGYVEKTVGEVYAEMDKGDTTGYDAIIRDMLDTPILQVDKKYIEKWIAGKEWSNYTIINNVNMLSCILNYAVTKKYIESNPCKSVAKPKAKAAKQKIYLTPDEARVLVHAARSNQNLQACILIGLYTGLRVSDICRLTAGNIQGEFITIDAKKTDTPTVIPIHPKLKPYLDYKIQHPYTESSVVDQIQTIRERGIMEKYFSFHSMRVTFTTWFHSVSKNTEMTDYLTSHSGRGKSQTVTSYLQFDMVEAAGYIAQMPDVFPS